MEEKCGGAVASHRRMPWDASIKSTTAKKTKKMMKAVTTLTLKISASMTRTLAAIAAKSKGMRLRIVHETPTSAH